MPIVAARDRLLELNAGTIYLVPLLPTALSVVRPRYPYALGLRVVDPTALTSGQLRVLTFLKSPEAQRFTLRLGGIVSFFLALTSALAVMFPYPREFTFGDGDYESWRAYSAFIFPVLVGGLASYGLHRDGAICNALRHWDRIQQSCAPFSPDRVSRAFFIGRGRHRLQSATVPPVLAGAALTAKQAFAIVAWLTGVPLVHQGLLEILKSGLIEDSTDQRNSFLVS